MSAGSDERRRLTGGPIGERGSSAVELVLLAPVLMLVVFLVVQAALYFYARQVLLAAAQQADRAARSATSLSLMSSDASTAGLGCVHTLGPDLVAAPTFAVARTATTATVVVTGRAVSIILGVALTIRAVATGPVEQFHPDVAGFTGVGAAPAGATPSGGGS